MLLVPEHYYLVDSSGAHLVLLFTNPPLLENLLCFAHPVRCSTAAPLCHQLMIAAAFVCDLHTGTRQTAGMAEGAASRLQYFGSGDEEESLEGSVESMTDESASILRASDSDSSSVATRHTAAGRGEIAQSDDRWAVTFVVMCPTAWASTCQNCLMNCAVLKHIKK